MMNQVKVSTVLRFPERINTVQHVLTALDDAMHDGDGTVLMDVAEGAVRSEVVGTGLVLTIEHRVEW